MDIIWTVIGEFEDESLPAVTLMIFKEEKDAETVKDIMNNNPHEMSKLYGYSDYLKKFYVLNEYILGNMDDVFISEPSLKKLCGMKSR